MKFEILVMPHTITHTHYWVHPSISTKDKNLAIGHTSMNIKMGIIVGNLDDVKVHNVTIVKEVLDHLL